MSIYKVLTFGTVFIGLLALIVVILLYTVTGGDISYSHGIVLDAGSSHTQVTLYQWPGDKNRCTGVVKEISTRKVHGGGISTYHDSDKVGETVIADVNEVSKMIDSDNLSKTPVYLGATAGMRLVKLANDGINKVNTIFNSIRNTLKAKTELLIEKIDIITGQDEGLFGWIAVNYLSDQLMTENFDESSQASAYGMMDMGGASAQIAYRMTDELKRKAIDTSDHVNIRLYGVNHTVKASSNLCFGIDQARLRFFQTLILKQSSSSSIRVPNPCLHKGAYEEVSGFKFKDQICLKRKDTKTTNESRNYTFVGTGDTEKCQEIVDELLDEYICNREYAICFNVSIAPPPDKTKFYAFSNYYYGTNVINVTGEITMKDFKHHVDQYCSTDWEKVLTNPKVLNRIEYAKYFCFTLHYIFLTLKNVYKFNENSWTNLYFTNNIKGTKLQWALGLMINATNAIPAEKPEPPVIGLVPFAILCAICLIIMASSMICAFKWYMQRKSKSKESNVYPL